MNENETIGYMGYMPEKFFAIQMIIPERDKQKLDENKIIDILHKTFVEDKSGEYFGIEWHHGDFDVFGKKVRGGFQVKYEEGIITIYPHKKTDSKLLIKVCKDIIEKVIKERFYGN